MTHKTPYEDDSLRMSSETELEEVESFIRNRLRNPYMMNGKIVWNFSNHKPNLDALEFCTENKLEKDKYIIPFQVTGSWGFMVHLLPEEMKRYEILVYKPQYEDYAAYSNLLAEMNDEELEGFKGELSEDLEHLDLE